jgi:hypothetical protein
VLFVPSQDRDGRDIDHDYWVTNALETLGTLFRGATAYPRARGVWRDDEREGELRYEEPTVVTCYADPAAMTCYADPAAMTDTARSFAHSCIVWGERRTREKSAS